MNPLIPEITDDFRKGSCAQGLQQRTNREDQHIWWAARPDLLRVGPLTEQQESPAGAGNAYV
jgi:hypothetical protein